MHTPLKIILKQHTPILHFLHDQKGVTLRATELKPKLDKYLWEKVFRRKLAPETLVYHKLYDPEKHRELGEAYLQGYAPAFDYRIRIKTDPSKVRSYDPSEFGGMYFGNMDDAAPPESKKYCMFTLDKIEIEFQSWHSKLLEMIRDAFGRFLAITNFGTRQNKGFGSFYIHPDDPLHVDFMKTLKAERDWFVYAEVDFERTQDFLQQRKMLLRDVDHTYKVMKSGFDFPDTRNGGRDAVKVGSYLFDYFKSQVRPLTTNEKQFIKSRVLGQSATPYNSTAPAAFQRAVLGLPGEFRYGNRVVLVNGGDVKRFKSPVMFKVVGNQFAIWGDESYKSIQGATIRLEYQNGHHEIVVPTGFDVKPFLLGFPKYFNHAKEQVDDRLLDRWDEGNVGRFLEGFLDTLNLLTLETYERKNP